MDQSPGNIQKIKRSDLVCKMDANCTNPLCPYKHSIPRQAACIYFLKGHCRAGSNCRFFHPFPPSPNPMETALKNSAMKNLAAKKVEGAEMAGNQGKAQEANSGESAVARPSPEGTGVPRKFILKRKTTPEAKVTSNISTSSVEKSKMPTPSAGIKGSRDMPIVIDSGTPAAEPSTVEKSVSSFNKGVAKPVQPATEQKKVPVKRPAPEATDTQTSKREKVERDKVIENVIEASASKAKEEPVVITISEEKKTEEAEGNSKERVITEEKAQPEVKEEVKHEGSQKPEEKEQPNEKHTRNYENKETKMQDANKEIAKDNTEEAKKIDEGANKEAPMQDIAVGSIIKEHKNQPNIMDEKGGKAKENEEKKVPAESKEEVKKAEDAKEVPVIKDKVQEEKMEDIEKPEAPPEPVQSSAQVSNNEEKSAQPEARKEQAPELKPSTEEKQAPAEVHKEAPAKLVEPKPAARVGEQEEVKAAPPKRKIKLMELVNEFEQMLSSNPVDEELARKYRIRTEPDPALDVSCAQR